MSLQVWLPLNGNLENQGMSSLSSISLSSYEWVNGKIGKCLKIPKVYSTEVVIPELIGCKKFSFSCWMYLDTSLTNGSYTRILNLGNKSDDNNGTIRIETTPTNGQFQIIYNKSASHGSNTYTYFGLVNGGTNATNKWLHVTVTHDEINTKTYFDGELKQTYLNSNIYTETEGLTGAFYIGGSYVNLNDVRIYDHCLSQKEVKEIAKGLALQYRLTGETINNGRVNLIKGSNTSSTDTNSFRQSNAVGGVSYSIIYEDGIPCVKTLRDDVEQSSWTFFSYNNFDPTVIKTNTTYTISFDIKPSVNGSIDVLGFVHGNATNSLSASAQVIQGNAVANQWNKIVLQTTTKADFTGLTIPGQCIYMSVSSSLRGTGVSMLLKNMKVEEGVNATPWCPNPADALYTSLGYNNNIVYDESGMNNNGVLTGPNIYPISSPRGSNGTYFPTNNYIVGKRLAPEEFTLASWVKPSAPTTYGNIYIGNWESGGGGIYNTAAAKMVFELFINGAYKVLTGATALVANTWYHVVCTYKNGVQKIYINGKQDGSLTTTLTFGLTYHPTAPWAINGNPNGTGSTVSPTGSAGYSDVRLYATALSAEDIKNLYNNGISIDGEENVFAYEFREEY